MEVSVRKEVEVQTPKGCFDILKFNLIVRTEDTKEMNKHV